MVDAKKITFFMAIKNAKIISAQDNFIWKDICKGIYNYLQKKNQV